ncbi:MAG: hypothetical protein ACTHQE_04670 [Thermomicrobiales bacterium]
MTPTATPSRTHTPTATPRGTPDVKELPVTGAGNATSGGGGQSGPFGSPGDSWLLLIAAVGLAATATVIRLDKRRRRLRSVHRRT